MIPSVHDDPYSSALPQSRGFMLVLGWRDSDRLIATSVMELCKVLQYLFSSTLRHLGSKGKRKGGLGSGADKKASADHSRQRTLEAVSSTLKESEGDQLFMLTIYQNLDTFPLKK